MFDENEKFNFDEIKVDDDIEENEKENEKAINPNENDEK